MSQSQNLLSSKDPMTYQAVSVMSQTSPDPTATVYFPRDDQSEAERYEHLVGEEGAADESSDDDSDLFGPDRVFP